MSRRGVAAPPSPSLVLLLAGTTIGVVALVAALVLGAAVVSSKRQDTNRSASATSGSNASTPEGPLVGEDTLYAVPGTTFVPAPFDTAELVKVAESEPGFEGAVRNVSARAVIRNGTTAAVVVVVQFSSAVASRPGYVGDFLKGVSQEAARSQPTTIGGNPGLSYVNHGLKSLVVVRGSVAVFVVAAQQAAGIQLDPIASGILGNVP